MCSNRYEGRLERNGQETPQKRWPKGMDDKGGAGVERHSAHRHH